MIRDDSPAYIFNAWAEKPTYHAYGHIREHADVTKCGIVIYADGRSHATTIRCDHAALFGIPCRRCFA